MPKTMRFCINCGREIGEAVSCTNPECGGIPNFYRDVPGPEHADRAAAEPGRRLPPIREKDGNGALADTAAFPETDDLQPARATVGLEGLPVAVLRSTGLPRAEHLLRPGSLEVGARPPAKLVIDRPEISSRHARLECLKDPAGGHRVTVVDHGSTNGTFVNGKRIKQAPLNPGDRIRFANVEFVFQLIEEDRPRVTIGI